MAMVSEKYGFGHDIIDWIKILLKKQKPSVMNGGHTAHYLKLECGAHQGDPILAYFLVLVLETEMPLSYCILAGK